MALIGSVDAAKGSAEVFHTETFTIKSYPKRSNLKVIDYNTYASIEMGIGAFNMGNFANIKVDGVDYSPNQRGLNIAVMNPASSYVDPAKVRNFDTHISEYYSRFEIVGSVIDGEFKPTDAYLRRLSQQNFLMDYMEVLPSDVEQKRRFLAGWGQPEDWGRWMTSKHAYLACSFNETLSQEFTIEIRALKAERQQGCEVKFNGVSLGKFLFPPNSEQWLVRRFLFDPSLIKPDINILSFHADYAATPAELNLGQDQRRLSLAIRSIACGAPVDPISE
jgi:hypothetical protein